MITTLYARYCSAAALLLLAGIVLTIAEGPLALSLADLSMPPALSPTHGQLTKAGSPAMASSDGKYKGEILKKGVQ